MADKADERTGRKAISTTSVGNRLKLQTNYGRALAWSRGFAAEATKAAYARALELSAATNSPDERFDSLYGRWVTSLTGGELGMAREIAEIFRREAENAGRITETAVGLRYLVLTCNLQGELREGEANLVRALELYDPERDCEANLRYGVDTRAGALSYLACAKWDLGEIAQVRGLREDAIAYALGTGHIPTIVGVYQTEAMLESLHGDAAATRRTAETVLELGRQHKLAVYVAWGQIYSG
jgi:hypothetical protein